LLDSLLQEKIFHHKIIRYQKLLVRDVIGIKC